MPSIRGQVDFGTIYNLIHLLSIIGMELVIWPDGLALFLVVFCPKFCLAAPLALVDFTISTLMVSKYSAVSGDSLFQHLVYPNLREWPDSVQPDIGYYASPFDFQDQPYAPANGTL